MPPRAYNDHRRIFVCIGLGNAIFFVLLGQIVAAAIIDHFGLLGAIQSAITPKRALGLVVMAVGLYLARKPV